MTPESEIAIADALLRARRAGNLEAHVSAMNPTERLEAAHAARGLLQELAFLGAYIGERGANFKGDRGHDRGLVAGRRALRAQREALLARERREAERPQASTG